MSAKAVGAILFTLLFFSGCATVETSRDPSRDRWGLASQPQVYVLHRVSRAPFWTGRLRAGLAGLGNYMKGLALEQRWGLVDPVSYTREKVKEVLEHELSLNNIRVVPDVASDGKIDTMKEKYSPGFVIEIRTWRWELQGYQAYYQASVRLIDVTNEKALWSSGCELIIVDDPKIEETRAKSQERSPFPTTGVGDIETDPREKALFDNWGALLKANLRKAAEACGDQIALRLLVPGRHARPSGAIPSQ